MKQHFTISNDPTTYEAFPDLVRTATGKLICVFAECTHHRDRSMTRIVLTESHDRGRTWSPKRPLTPSTKGRDYYYNCPRISQLRDGRLCIVVDRPMLKKREQESSPEASNFLYFSSDDGVTWGEPVVAPIVGIVPDKLLELDTGRWILSAQYYVDGDLAQFLRYSDDQGQTWSDSITVARQKGLKLCEVSILPVGDSKLVAFLRENSFMGWDCKKTISHDNGATWGPVIDFPLPGCHRPVAGRLQNGQIMIAHRYMQGGKGWVGYWTQNFFAAITDVESALATNRNESWARILPIDYDRSPHSDLGYSGWVQFPDGEIYIAYYIVDDAIDKGQIRGCSLHLSDFILPEAK